MVKEKVSQVATLLSGFVMAGCCLGPFILIPLGLTGFAGGLAIYATRYQAMLITVTLVLLAYSFYLIYGRKCKKRSSIVGLWITTVLVLGMFGYMLMAEGYL